MNDTPEISGLLYKKRGGFGKFVANPWQFRYFSISKDGILSYYDTDSPEIVRGKLDLKCSFELVSDLPIEGAPNGYGIQIIPSGGEERWKLCADTKEDHNRWCKVLEKYMGEKPAHPSISCISDDEVDPKKSADRASSPTFFKKELGTNEKQSAGKTVPPVSPMNASRPANLPLSPNAAGTTSGNTPFHTPGAAPTTATASTTAAAVSAAKGKSKSSAGGKKRLKLGNKVSMVSAESCEALMVLIIVNIAFYVLQSSSPFTRKACFVAIANFVVVRTLQLRAFRAHATPAAAAPAEASAVDAGMAEVKPDAHHHTAGTTASGSKTVADRMGDAKAALESRSHSAAASTAAGAGGGHSSAVTTTTGGKPTPGFTFVEVHTEPRLSPPHTWCRVDHRQFNVRVGPDYNRYKKKAPSGTPIYEPFAVDVFCTKQRVDHAAQRFQLPDTSHINTHHPHVPPIMVLQIQIPSEPPSSIFSSSEDGPGWAIVMYFRITEDSCNQLKDLSTAAPHIKLFAEWCEKAPTDPAWRGRFKVINSCTNLEELGMPSAIVSYNAKPVLIRRTGTIFKGPNYMEMNIHVHKFANLAKQSIYLISSRCGLMFMQIGFVIEGRDDKELPETLFACVAVNKPQEDQAEFIFEDDEA